MRMKIVAIGKDDAYYSIRKNLIGRTTRQKRWVNYKGNGWYGGEFLLEDKADTPFPFKDDNKTYYFYRVRLTKIKE